MVYTLYLGFVDYLFNICVSLVWKTYCGYMMIDQSESETSL